MRLMQPVLDAAVFIVAMVVAGILLALGQVGGILISVLGLLVKQQRDARCLS
jgi:hypothetical protein